MTRSLLAIYRWAQPGELQRARPAYCAVSAVGSRFRDEEFQAMKLWVLAVTVRPSPALVCDAERNLTEHGRWEPLYTSPADAQLMRETLGLAEDVRTLAWWTPQSSPHARWVEQLERVPITCCWSAINRLVGSLDSFLHYGHLRKPPTMHTAGPVAETEGDWPLPGLMTLKALGTPDFWPGLLS
ncbi:hypothetical protein FQR65_LT20800 [Abscondita terminalis]|nr:hypothetical protein FQR65_LT20800 [Abscondita terminalis]